MTEHEKSTHLKDELADMKGKLERLAAAADKLRNKHLADIIKAGIGRIHMALGHPDIELLSDEALQAEREKSDGEKRAEAERFEADVAQNPFPSDVPPSQPAPNAAYGQTG